MVFLTAQGDRGTEGGKRTLFSFSNVIVIPNEHFLQVCDIWWRLESLGDGFKWVVVLLSLSISTSPMCALYTCYLFRYLYLYHIYLSHIPFYFIFSILTSTPLPLFLTPSITPCLWHQTILQGGGWQIKTDPRSKWILSRSFFGNREVMERRK